MGLYKYSSISFMNSHKGLSTRCTPHGIGQNLIGWNPAIKIAKPPQTNITDNTDSAKHMT